MADSDALVRAAASLELLQACALIHDDVMDGSDTRRGMPSMPSTNRGRNVELNETNISQKWTWASFSLNFSPTIFGIQ